MDDVRWDDVKRIFQAAITVQPSGREALIERDCAGDDALAAEIRSLLSAHERGMLFLETPAVELQPSWFTPACESLERTGAWRILRNIGKGGMADVYLAERADGQFQKQVAVKVLQAGLFGEDVRARFAREQQVLADLDHPNIVRLLDGGITGDHRPYLVMDFVDGVRITDYAVSRHLPRRARLELFLRVCDAVSHAHHRGVIHRDLKPANILVASDGTPKLLDFGIAKLLPFDSAGHDHTLTTTRSFTPGYASPEQVRGESVTSSSDVYSLGLVLFELMLDRRPFELDALAPHEAARVVCEQMPDATRLPRRLARIVTKAIRKTPAERYSSVDDFARDVRRYLAAPGREWISARRVRYAAAVVACLAIVLAAGPLVTRLSQELASRQAPVLSVQRLTDYAGVEDHPSLSPSGRSVVFGRFGGVGGIWIRAIDSAASSQLTNEIDCCPAWSPDNKSIAFVRRAGSDIYDVLLISPNGGPEHKIARIQGVAISWAPDSRMLAVVDRSSSDQPFSIYLISRDGRERHKVTYPPANSWGDVECAFSPDGRSVALVRYASRGNGDIYIVPASGGEGRRITYGEGWISGLTWTTDGREIVFAATRAKASNKAGLWRVSVRGPPNSEPVLIPGAEGVFSRPSIAGRRLVFQADDWRANLWRMPLAPGGSALPVRVLGSWNGEETPAYSPDGKRLAFFANTGGDDAIWTANVDGSNAYRITFTRVFSPRWPSWSPDRSRITYISNEEGLPSLYVTANKGGTPRRLPIGQLEAGAPSWSHDGRWIYFRCEHGGTSQICKIAADGKSEPVQITKRGGVEAFEAGGETALYFLRSHDYGTLMSVPISGGLEQELAGSPRVKAGFWTVTTKGIYFFGLQEDRRGDDPIPVKRFDPATRHQELLGWIHQTEGALMPRISVRPDGGEIAWSRSERGSDLMLMEGFR